MNNFVKNVEDKRLEFKKKYMIYCYISAAILGADIILLIFFFVYLSSVLFILFLITFTGALLLASISYVFINKDYVRWLKKEVELNSLELNYDEYEFDSHNGISYSEIDECEALNNVTNYQSKYYLKARKGDIKFKSCSYSYDDTREETQKEMSDVFGGRVVIYDLPIQTNEYISLINREIKLHYIIHNPRIGSKMILSDEELEKRFVVYSNDQNETNRFLNNRVLKKIYDLDVQLDLKLSAIYKKDKVYVFYSDIDIRKQFALFQEFTEEIFFTYEIFFLLPIYIAEALQLDKIK